MNFKLFSFLTFLSIVSFWERSPAVTSLLLDSELSQDYSSTNVGVDSSTLPPIDADFYFSQSNLNAGGSQSKTEDAVTGTITTFKTQYVGGGFGIGYGDSWNFDISALSSRTSETKYSQGGTDAVLSYSHSFASANEESFSPRLSLGLGAGQADIEQTLSFTILNFSAQRTVELTQKKITAFIGFSPVSWLKLRLSGSAYSYSRAKTDLQKAFNNRFLNFYTSDLVSTIGGLPESMGSLKMTFYLSDVWDLEVLGSNTHLIVDDSNSKRGHLLLSRSFEKLIVGAGVSRIETSQNKEFSFLLNLSYDL